MSEDLAEVAENMEISSEDGAQDASDSKSWLSSLIGDKEEPKIANMPVEKDAEEYNMNHKHRGKAVIFNHKVFKVDGLNARSGTDADRDNLSEVLRKLDFEVEVYNDLTRLKLLSRISDLAGEDHSDRDCLLVCVFSHGIENEIYALDGKYKPDNLWNAFTAESCPTLAGKPKIFLIQACQGNKLEDGITLRSVPKDFQFLQTDSNSDVPDSRAQNTSYKIPNRSDFLMVYSSFPGYYSWRNQAQGSWFIQSVCKVFKKNGYHKEIQAMMTAVSRNVALNFESYVPNNQEMDQKKQQPFVCSTLIRECYFRPKKDGECVGKITTGDVIDSPEIVENPETPPPNFRQAKFALINPNPIDPSKKKSAIEVAPDASSDKYKDNSSKASQVQPPKIRFSLVKPTDNKIQDNK